MVQRLNAQQTQLVVRDLVSQGLCDYQIPDKMSPEAMEKACVNIVSNPTGRAYGWFDSGFTPRGILVGMVVPDPMTGLLHGYEHVWWMASEFRGFPGIELMRAFEEDCRESKATRVTFGFSHYRQPKAMARMYRRHGYAPYNTSVSKEI